MKATRLLLIFVGCGALTLGIGYAGEPPSQPLAKDSHQNPAASVPVNKGAGVMINKTENRREQPALLPVGSATTAPRPGIVPSRSVPAAAVGALTASNAKHPAPVIDGTAVKHKP